MARKTFFSFHYKPDCWRASQVRQMGALEGNSPVSDNDWESITSGGEGAIKKWISEQMSGRSCVVVLAGSNTAGRKWINYEIEKGWADGKGVVAIHIHGLLNSSGIQSAKGSNPLKGIKVGSSGTDLSSIAKCYDTPYTSSKYVYEHIEENIANWVDEAIKIRNNF